MEEKIQALMENAEFAAKMEQAESVAELVALFNAEGVEVTEAALKQAMKTAENEEMDEAALESVAGGASLKTVFSVAKVGAKALLEALKNTARSLTI